MLVCAILVDVVASFLQVGPHVTEARDYGGYAHRAQLEANDGKAGKGFSICQIVEVNRICDLYQFVGSRKPLVELNRQSSRFYIYFSYVAALEFVCVMLSSLAGRGKQDIRWGRCAGTSAGATPGSTSKK